MPKLIPRFLSGLAVVLTVLLAGPLLLMAFDTDVQASDWRTASSDPVGWAPDPKVYKPAVVQAYCAPAVSWRGAFGDHCWVAGKPEGASSYRRYEVIGFRLRRNGTSLVETETPTPDREWYGSAPKLVRDIRGPEAEAVIAALPMAVAAYPNAKTYRVWPGPNSNTFIAHIAREIPEFGLALPGKALGKDYMGWKVIAAAPSGTGFQVSLGGLFGVLLAAKEGFELNILGLVVGANPMDLAITLPGIGRIPAKADWTDGASFTGQVAEDVTPTP